MNRGNAALILDDLNAKFTLRKDQAGTDSTKALQNGTLSIKERNGCGKECKSGG